MAPSSRTVHDDFMVWKDGSLMSFPLRPAFRWYVGQSDVVPLLATGRPRRASAITAIGRWRRAWSIQPFMGQQILRVGASGYSLSPDSPPRRRSPTLTMDL